MDLKESDSMHLCVQTRHRSSQLRNVALRSHRECSTRSGRAETRGRKTSFTIRCKNSTWHSFWQEASSRDGAAPVDVGWCGHVTRMMLPYSRERCSSVRRCGLLYFYAVYLDERFNSAASPIHITLCMRRPYRIDGVVNIKRFHSSQGLSKRKMSGQQLVFVQPQSCLVHTSNTSNRHFKNSSTKHRNDPKDRYIVLHIYMDAAPPLWLRICNVSQWGAMKIQTLRFIADNNITAWRWFDQIIISNWLDATLTKCGVWNNLGCQVDPWHELLPLRKPNPWSQGTLKGQYSRLEDANMQRLSFW